jgi:hypothetical protein
MKVRFMRSNLNVGEDSRGFVNCSFIIPSTHLRNVGEQNKAEAESVDSVTRWVWEKIAQKFGAIYFCENYSIAFAVEKSSFVILAT